MPLDIDALTGFIENEFRKQFRSVIDQITLPIPRRVDNFTCWPGLTVLGMEDAQVVCGFERNPSKIRIGDHVYVNDATVEPKDVISGPQGVVREIDERARTIRIEPGFQQQSRFESRYRVGQKLVVDHVLPGEHHGRTLPLLALRLLHGTHGSSERLRRIRDILEGKRKAEKTGDRPVDFGDPKLAALTEAQREAIRRVVDDDLVLIQGPPGTGKTHVLGLAIRELVMRGKKVAVSAFTHQAINNVLLECADHVEIRDLAKIGSRTQAPQGAGVERMRLHEKAGAYFRLKTVPDVTGLTQYAAFHPVSRALEDGKVEAALPERFDVLVFDEASQLTIPAAVMAMVQADRFVFAGDHRQLPPVVSTVRPGLGPAVSVFQHLAEIAGHDSVLLDRTFRLNRALTEFPSREFYEGRLEAAPIARERRLAGRFEGRYARYLDPETPSTLVLVKHLGRGQESPEEAALTAEIVATAVRGGVPVAEIAVIAPHRRQIVRIVEALTLAGVQPLPLVDTVERIQGQERDLIVLSMTLSDPDALTSESEFLFLPNRFNVALTRARKKLILMASPAFFRALPRKYALEGDAADALAAMNVLKRWYFAHRDASLDGTACSEAARESLARVRSKTAGSGDGGAG